MNILRQGSVRNIYAIFIPVDIFTLLEETKHKQKFVSFHIEYSTLGRQFMDACAFLHLQMCHKCVKKERKMQKIQPTTR